MTALIAFAACSTGLAITAVACLFTLMFETMQSRTRKTASAHELDTGLVATAGATS